MNMFIQRRKCMPNGLQIIGHESVSNVECLCEVDMDKILLGLEKNIQKTNKALTKLQKQPCKYTHKKISTPIKIWKNLFI